MSTFLPTSSDPLVASAVTFVATTPVVPPAAPLAAPSDDAPLAPPATETADIAQLIQQVHAGNVDAATLTIEVRRQCVACLTTDGFSSLDIAQLLRLPERTIRRDRAANRQDEAISPSLTLGDELLGEFQRFTLASIQRLTRLCRNEEIAPYARLWAEESISRIYRRFLDAARLLHHVDNTDRRLRRQRDCDPAEQEAAVKQWQAEMTRVGRMMRG